MVSNVDYDKVAAVDYLSGQKPRGYCVKECIDIING